MKPPAGPAHLPVDPERLRRQFPSLTDDDLEAYVEVTRRVLAAADRPRLVRELMERGRAARRKAAEGGDLTEDEDVALRYLAAVEQMQRPLAGPRPGGPAQVRGRPPRRPRRQRPPG